MATLRKALITGGASGLGLAVAKSLLETGEWTVSLLDTNEQRGTEVASTLGSRADFKQVDVTDYASLSAAFKAVYEQQQRLDFVFANAGVVSAQDFYAESGLVGPPTEPSYKTLDIDLRAVINTSVLARHYLARADNKARQKSLIITASCGGFYAVPNDPLYAAAKHGIIGFVRSIARRYWNAEKIRVNAICPGLMRTNILPDAVFKMFPEDSLTSVERVVEVVKMLLVSEKYVGQTVEVFGNQHWFRKQIEYCEPGMAAMMGVTEEL
ncbi:hypothetical protein LTR56_023017 [Elasticomyces elasticus]|nr:hypothetical protein LTR56_023017 [Elasticomyces elasticus]KAK3668123.1 hypothetical protein LTR22_001194 [Elasticomyces elasticus]KAK4925271.1 hypothetical protein LTR49_007812 [Elasticomyces elasticus]KAK5752872.1 hypothetical protein LTS12_017043 [Elasticomyces elasticus]